MTTSFFPYRTVIYRITALLLLINFTLPAAAHDFGPGSLKAISEFRVTQQPQPHPVYDISPPSGVPGRAYAVNIISHDPSKKQITAQTSVFAPAGINVSDVTMIANNGLSATITIPDDAPLGHVQIVLKDTASAGATIIGVADFDITSVAQGAIPPGLDPEVDVMWTVMAKNVVHHNFGSKIAKHYYGIQLSIGNNSGFDLQIASVGFRLPANTNIKNIVPTNSYRATRGTLEREQEIGTRAKVFNSLKTAGLLLTGFLPFWHVLGPAANAARFADILNGPVITGVGLVYPDTTVSQMTRLDDQMLRDGLIIKNNSQVRTTVFVPKQLLNIAKNEGVNDDKTLKRYNAEKKKGIDYRNDPQYVNLRLGDLVLIGQAVKYLNRVQVIRTSEGGPVTPPPTVVGINPQTVMQGPDAVDLTIPGSNLDNAVITPIDPDTNTRVSGIEFTGTASDASGHILRTTVSVKDAVPPKRYRIVISTPGGSVETTLAVIAQP
ncbi:MAG TPA: hypothetical protein VFI24_20330 [Pyrinomonadaceae bacterium]|nr:hypothetical protein [Pyrinomonadaceae bacterium]